MSRARSRSRRTTRAGSVLSGALSGALALAAALAVSIGALLALAAPAGAHAVVVSTNPVDGQILSQSPESVQIQFSEQVSIDLGGLTVLDSSGEKVSEGEGEVSSGGELLKTSVPKDLPDGSYVANYRVVSADGHPISGAIVFGVGDATVIDGSVRTLAASDQTGYEVAAAVFRFVTYLGALLAGGLAVFAAFVHDQRPDRRAIDRLTHLACIVGAVGMVAWIACQAALTTGDGLSAMVDPTTLRKTLADGLGWQSALLLLGLAASYVAVDVRRVVVAQSCAFYGCLAIGFSFIFWGHAREAPNTFVAMGADAIHGISATIWFGGLVGLALTLVARRRAPIVEGVVLSTAEIVVRFSTMAACTIVALIVAGTALAWQEVGSLDALVSTTYGRLVIAKIVAVGLILVIAGFNRYRLVPDVARAGLAGEEADRAGDDGDQSGDRPSGDDDRRATDELAEQATTAWKRLTATVRMEALLIVVVLALTAVLVNVVPARSSGNEAPLFNQTIAQGELSVNLVVVPAKVGRNSLHIQYSDASGKPVDSPRSLEIEMSLPDKGIGPLSVDVLKGGPGHFVAEGAQIPVSGSWEITLVGRVSDFATERTVFQVKIG